MGKLRSGPPVSLLKCSNGADNNKMNFYSSTYSSCYGKEGFVARSVKPRGTGYLASFRPAINYSTGIDKLDNVPVGKILEDNYSTSYYKQHQPYYCGSNGTDKLPLRITRNESGFTQKIPITTADTKVVQQSRVETIDKYKYRPLLHRLQNKQVGHLDDGSLHLATETNLCYKGEPSKRMSTHLKDIGVKEPSGFTHYHHFDPVQYLPRAPFNGERPCINRPTGFSQNQRYYKNWPNMSGCEMNHGICKRAQRDNGYSYETARPRFVNRVPEDSFTKLHQVPYPVIGRIKKKDPCEFVNMSLGSDHSTLAKTWFRGEQPPRGGGRELGPVGRKEFSGYSANNDRYVGVDDDRSRFTTHYNVKYGESLHERNYKGWAHTTDLGKPKNGFTKSTTVHIYGDGKRFKESDFESYHPLVSKVIKMENPGYVDNTRNMKRREMSVQ
nr:protein phosphatase 1 regulatory subunit 32-like [Ciona intestinalis]|eukprot:XP_002128219.3 protein phosphatase 1 regulatory subunit 32-like [Ciona intestinalis]